MNNATWGSNPAGKTSSPQTPVTDGKDGKMYFTPVSGVVYHVTILLGGQWQQPLEIWTHDIKPDGKYQGNIYCQKKSYDDSCLACTDNSQAEYRAGRTLKNGEKPNPLSKKLLFAVMVDELPEYPYLWYKTSEKFVQLIQQAANAQGGMDKKFAFSRLGTGINTTYTCNSTGMPIDVNKLNQVINTLPPCTKDTFIDTCDYSRFTGNNNQMQDPWQQQTQQQYQYTPQQTTPTQPQTQYQQPVQNNSPIRQQQPVQQQPTHQQPPATQQSGQLSQQAQEFVIDFGPYQGQKMVDLDSDKLQTIANSTVGPINQCAVEILKSRGL